jgi:hypothetical protein
MSWTTVFCRFHLKFPQNCYVDIIRLKPHMPRKHYPTSQGRLWIMTRRHSLCNELRTSLSPPEDCISPHCFTLWAWHAEADLFLYIVSAQNHKSRTAAHLAHESTSMFLWVMLVCMISSAALLLAAFLLFDRRIALISPTTWKRNHVQSEKYIFKVTV